jgi:cytochrome c553
MPKHIARLTLLLVAFAAVAYATKQFLTAPTFYDYGHYRGDSVAEIASDKPKYKGSNYCQPCHGEVFATWSKGVHHSVDAGKAVQCEVCHAAAGGRNEGGAFQHVATGTDHPASGKLPIPKDTLKLCPVCHEKMPGRPLEQRQIVVAAHAGTQQCTTCHNAHSPKIIVATASGAAAGDSASGKPANCAGCHGPDGVSTNPAWPNLAGQHGPYLIDALKAYKSGARDNVMMAATAKGLNDADMQRLASYYAGVKTKAAASKASEKDLATGKEKATACAACHGANGVSTNPGWPSLAGQHKDYLVAVLKDYKAGTRKNELMSGVAKGLSDADIDTLATYFSSSTPQ